MKRKAHFQRTFAAQTSFEKYGRKSRREEFLNGMEEYMRNQAQIATNAGWNSRMGAPGGAVRSGPALLAGLLRCARCGRALQATYTQSKNHGPLPRYICGGSHSRKMVRNCVTFAGTRVDGARAVTRVPSFLFGLLRGVTCAWGCRERRGRWPG